MEYETKLSDIIASLPEVSGGFLYSSQQGVYSNQTAAFANDSSLVEVGRKLSKIVATISELFQDTGGIRVSFRDLILYGTQIETDHWLFLLHQPSLSSGMLKMTVRMALNIDSGVGSSDEEDLPDAQNQEKTIPDESTGINESMIDILLAPESELKEPLEAMEEKLAHFIGPVAGLVFKDSVENWAQNATPSMENIPELIGMIEKEIDDEEDRIKFKNSFPGKEGE